METKEDLFQGTKSVKLFTLGSGILHRVAEHLLDWTGRFGEPYNIKPRQESLVYNFLVQF